MVLYEHIHWWILFGKLVVLTSSCQQKIPQENIAAGSHMGTFSKCDFQSFTIHHRIKICPRNMEFGTRHLPSSRFSLTKINLIKNRWAIAVQVYCFGAMSQWTYYETFIFITGLADYWLLLQPFPIFSFWVILTFAFVCLYQYDIITY